MKIKNNKAITFMLENIKFVYFFRQMKIQVYDEVENKRLDTINLPKEINNDEFRLVARRWKEIKK